MDPTIEPPRDSTSATEPKQRTPCPELHANFLSRLVFGWVFATVYRGWKKPMQDEDLWELPEFERGRTTTAKVMQHLREKPSTEGGEEQPVRLANAIFTSTQYAFIQTFFLRCGVLSFELSLPVFLNRIINFLSQPADSDTRDPLQIGIAWAAGLLIVATLKIFFENHYFLRTFRMGMRVRSSMQGALYHKSLLISPSARASSSLGEIVNLMQLDSQRIGDFFQVSHILWAAPIQIIVTVGLLYNFIGPAALIGLLLTLVTLPLQGKVMATQFRLRAANIRNTDKRVKLMNEVLQGIKAVKFYAWEAPFADAVRAVRALEVEKLYKVLWMSSATISILMSLPILIGVITFAFYKGVFKQDLNPARIITGIALLNQLRVPVLMLPMVINNFIDARVSVKRLERFFELENTDNYSRKGNNDPAKKNDSFDSPSTSDSSMPSNASIVIENGEFEWSQISGNPLKIEKKKRQGLRGLRSYLPKRKRRNIPHPPTEVSAGKTTTTNVVPSSAPGVSSPANSLQKYVSLRGSILRDINVSFEAGKLSAVVGYVGSGKSSLFHAILGEMRKVSGGVRMSGSVAYVAQTAWIFHASLRENILFGKEYDEELYKLAIEVSALQQDIDVLPAGDMTSIGEKGINLSGGQKQRVSIARAVFAQADIYLFDDPLSALDAHVSKHVFERCISNSGILKDKLRILITNQTYVLPECDQIVFLDSGIIRSKGSFEEVSQSDEAFRSLMAQQQSALDSDGDEAKKEGGGSDSAKVDSKKAPEKGAEKSSSQVGQDIMKQEERKTGKVGSKSYVMYLRYLGNPLVIVMLLVFFVLTTGVSVVVQWWLAYWAQQEELFRNGERASEPSLGFFLGMYFAFAIAYALMSFCRSLWFLSMALKASKKLHSTMLDRVLHAPLSFFDTTPTGRVLSRFSKDVQSLDEKVPQNAQQMLNTTLQLFTSYIFIGIILPLFFAVAAPITAFYFGLQRFFNRTSVELKRIDAISRSPIYANFSETLGGLSTLRAYSKQEQWRNENFERIDLNQRAYFMWIVATRWFTFYLEVAGILLVFATALIGVFSRDSKYSGAVGLALTYALQVTQFLGFTVRSITELEAEMNAVERANYYSNELPQEAPHEIKGVVEEEWPAAGAIEFEDVRMRYREGLPLVLDGVSVKIEGGEKVGVVGRTGSGKSSMMIALLRMVEATDGRVLVDGQDLREVGLLDVRKRMTIIPQDPVMFSGTIRFNLDPFSEHSDVQLWDALEKSHMKEFVSEYEEGLDAPVSEYGENLSAGQKQVICLTRALLRNTKILILDEASSSLDSETDRLIQETIRTHLKDATILTIAHRLFTLADYDRILVMDDGRVGEYGTPRELLADGGGQFSALVNSMGPTGASHFRSLVRDASE